MTTRWKSAAAVALLSLGTLIGCGGGVYYAGVMVGPPPPPPVYGPIGVAPAPGFIWINGWYELEGGRWVWHRGYWARPPHPGYVWVEPHWERRGNGWVRHGGRWQRHR